MVFESFLYRYNKNLPFRSLLVKATTSILSLALSIKSASLLKRDMYDLSVSSSRYLMLIKQALRLLIPMSPNEVRSKLSTQLLESADGVGR